MTVNISRSQSGSLIEGSTDGKYRKRRPDTEVQPVNGDAIMMANRAGLHPDMNYGFINSEVPAASRVSPGKS
jgi:hypothetical protein